MGSSQEIHDHEGLPLISVHAQLCPGLPGEHQPTGHQHQCTPRSPGEVWCILRTCRQVFVGQWGGSWGQTVLWPEIQKERLDADEKAKVPVCSKSTWWAIINVQTICWHLLLGTLLVGPKSSCWHCCKSWIKSFNQMNLIIFLYKTVRWQKLVFAGNFYYKMKWEQSEVSSYLMIASVMWQ